MFTKYDCKRKRIFLFLFLTFSFAESTLFFDPVASLYNQLISWTNSSHESEFLYTGWPVPLTKELHPAFKLVYQLAETMSSAKRNFNVSSEEARFFNLLPSINIDQETLQFADQIRIWPRGSILLSKANIIIPVKNAGMYKSAFNFDIFVNVPLDNIVNHYVKRKRRSASSREQLLQKKRDERLNFFSQMEHTLGGYNIASRGCLLRTLCEVAEAPFLDGLLGEILNVVLRANIVPEDNIEQHFKDDEYDDYLKAEFHGKTRGNCHQIYSETCEKSIFDILPQIEHSITTNY